MSLNLRDPRTRIRTQRAVPSGTAHQDRTMELLIRSGGAGVLLIVFGLFLFILIQALPLFQGVKATVAESWEPKIPVESVLALGFDPLTDEPVLLDRDFIRHSPSGTSREVFPVEASDVGQATVITVLPGSARYLAGTDRGRIVAGRFHPGASIEQQRHRIAGLDQDGEEGLAEVIDWELPRASVWIDLHLTETAETRWIAGLYRVANGGWRGRVQLFERVRSLFSEGKLTPVESLPVELPQNREPTGARLGAGGRTLLILFADGSVGSFAREADSWLLLEWIVEGRGSEAPSAKLEMLLGNRTAVLADPGGRIRLLTEYVDSGTGHSRWSIREPFPRLAFEGETARPVVAASGRNRGFLVGTGSRLMVGFSTTGSVRWREELAQPVQHLALDRRYQRFAALLADGRVTTWNLADPHPQAGWKAFFGKVLYEGQSEPRWIWQSTGGTMTFEPKLSLLPLFAGTFKGTFFAMLFALPVALGAALYTSEFMNPRLRGIVKPAMEIMASIPSVILGFIGALWLAPRLDGNLAELLSVALLAPILVAMPAYAWNRWAPVRWISRTRGFEFLWILPLLAVGLYAGIAAGGFLDQLLADWAGRPGEAEAGLQVWIQQLTGADYSQRNALAVGFVMGFAVIPVIYTLADDALAGVPEPLRSASLAIGASRWRTAREVIIPVALAGISGAVMIGVARAIGETMIVVMATGNTPVMELNPLTGFRALSANLAIELPEASRESTLYRTLFFASLLLFLTTFLANTVAELFRSRLRKHYSSVL